MDNKLIQALKKNEKPFGRMTKDMQDAAMFIGIEGDFQVYKPFPCGKLDWWMCETDLLNKHHTYRLRPDYEQEPEIVKCEVDSDDNYLSFNRPNGAEMSICSAVNCGDFIGFKYKDERIEGGLRVSGSPRLYMDKLGYTTVNTSTADQEVLTPTHVLFKRSK